MTKTLTTEIDLVCGENLKRRLLSTVLMLGKLLPLAKTALSMIQLGLFFGSIIGGHIGDRLGRRKTLLVRN